MRRLLGTGARDQAGGGPAFSLLSRRVSNVPIEVMRPRLRRRPICSPAQLLVAGSLKLTVIAGRMEELPRDFIMPVQTQSCVQPATHRKPSGVYYSVKANCHISQQIEFDV